MLELSFITFIRNVRSNNDPDLHETASSISYVRTVISFDNPGLFLRREMGLQGGRKENG